MKTTLVNCIALFVCGLIPVNDSAQTDQKPGSYINTNFRKAVSQKKLIFGSGLKLPPHATFPNASNSTGDSK